MALVRPFTVHLDVDVDPVAVQGDDGYRCQENDARNEEKRSLYARHVADVADDRR